MTALRIHLWLLLWLVVITTTIAINNSPSAYIEIILYEPDQKSGRYLTKTSNVHGYFSTVGSSAPAEGNIKMMHPLGLCLNNNPGDFPNYPYGWVGVIKLEPPHYGPESCRLVITKAKRAIEKGATAVIFDITNHPEALEQLNSVTPNLLNRPVIVVKDDEAEKLLNLLKEEVEITEEARARIERSVYQEPNNNHMFDVGLFIVCFTMVFILGIILIAKFKCFRKRREISLNNISKSALGQMKTRKYRNQRMKKSKRKEEVDDNCSKSIASSGGAMCAICLEEFNDGQELRVVPCGHEFHRKCIDKWLNEKWTCPLCNMNVLEHLSLDYAGVEASNNNNEDGRTETRNSRQASVDNVSMFQMERDPTSQEASIHLRHDAFPTQLITASELTTHRNLARCVFAHQRAVNNMYVATPTVQQHHHHQSSRPPTDSNSSHRYSHNHRYSAHTDKTLSSCRAIYGSNPSVISVENLSSAAEGNTLTLGTYKVSSTSCYHNENLLSNNHCANCNTKHQYLQSASVQSTDCAAATQNRYHQQHTNITTSCASNLANDNKIKATNCRRQRNKFSHSKPHDNILFNKPSDVGLWQSGYSPDSSDTGESNFSISYVRRKRNESSTKHKEPVANISFNPTYEAPVVLSDSSVRCHYGSSTIYNPQNKTRSIYPMWLANNIKVTDRPSTPCIGYSSSDDAENMIRFSNSSLEGVLG